MESFQNDLASLPRNMIENSMFEEEPDVVDLAKETPVYPLDPDDVVYEPRSSRLLVRGLGENDLDEEEEDYESSARLLGMSFMNRSSSLRANTSPYARQEPVGSCSMPSPRTMIVGVFILVVVASVAMVIYFLPRCTFTKEGCHKANTSMELIYPISTSGELFPWTDLRLPVNVRPIHYDLLIHPNLTTMTFQGTVSITIQVVNDTNKVILHASDMDITKATVQDKELRILEYKSWEQIAVNLPEDFRRGSKFVLTLEYNANLSNSYIGFYNSSYIAKSGTRRVLVATQFEPLGARKAFPCFDEPAFKATFLVKIKREAGYISLSNMPMIRTTKLTDNLFQDEFEKSVTMSTYLVAFIVANFTSESKNVSGTLVSVYAVPEKKDQVVYALETGAKLLEYYNTFFDIKYPLSKLDLVAIPDFLAGAMENWGLITFRETSLLVRNESSVLDKQLVTSVIAHELAHQWFGNLVTMKWWNDLWLNEGFATYMQYTSIMKEFPDLEIGDDFLRMRFQALSKDALNSSHPISATVKTPEQVEEMFDSVSYEKGASILLMLNSLLSEEQFQKGVITYLNAYKNKNTGNDDLWNSLSEVAKQSYSIADMMNTWTLQKGFPLVTVNRVATRVRVSQEHFLLKVDSDNSTAKSVSKSLWHIPLTYVNDSCTLKTACKQVLLLTERTVTFDIPKSVKWLKLNFRNEGFYIVDYGVQGWKELVEALNSNLNVLTHEDRCSLINNIFALSRLGKVPFKQVLSLLVYLRNETESGPLMEALSQLTHIYGLLDKRQELLLVPRMKSYITDHFGDLMDSQVWEDEGLSVSKKNLRSSLLELACSFNRNNCTKKAEEIFKKWSNGTEKIPGDLMKTVFSVGAQTDDGWVKLLETYKHSKVDAEKRKMLRALASTQDVRRIVWLMKASLDGSEVQTQELPLVLHTICKNFPGHLYAWDFVKENWDDITKRFPLGSFAMQSIIMSTTSQFSSKAHLLEVQNFFGSLKERGSQLRSVQEAAETIKLNMQWMDNNLNTLRQWL